VESLDGKVWDVDRREEVFYLRGAEVGGWSPDSRRFCSIVPARDSTRVVIWDSATFREVGALPGATSLPTWLPGGRRLLTTVSDRQSGKLRLRIWDASVGYERAATKLVPPDLVDWANRSLTLLQSGDVLRDTGRFAAAERVYRQALAIQGELIARAPLVLEHRQRLGRLYFGLGIVLRETGRTEKARAAFRQALSIQEPLEQKGLSWLREELDRTHDELGRLLERTGRLDEAKQQYAQVRWSGVYAEAWRRMRTVWVLAHSPEPEIKDSREDHVIRFNSATPVLQRVTSPAASDQQIWVNTRWSTGSRAFRYDASPFARQFLEKGLEKSRLLIGRVHFVKGPTQKQGGFLIGDRFFFFKPGHPAIRSIAVWFARETWQWIKDESADTQCKADVLATVGMALYRAGLWKEAIDALEQARAMRKGAEAVDCFFRAMSHWQLGQKEEAREWYERALRQMDNAPPRDGEALRLCQEAEDLLLWNKQPKDAAQRLALAEVHQEGKQYSTATRFYSETFAIQPGLTANPLVHRYNAACAAALAGCGQGKDAADLPEKEGIRLRKQALAWLHADLDAWRRVLEKGAARARPVIVGQMQHWRQDADFIGVRDKGRLALLPAQERAAWIRLWTDVSDLLARAKEPPPTDKEKPDKP
jgi:tetratricopeptide (TPR) repeat protein